MEELEEEQLNNKDNSSNKKSVGRNYIYNLIYQLLLVIVPLIVTPYISRVLLPEGVGKYSYSYSLITYFTIFGALGFGYYAQRQIAMYQGDTEKQAKIFWEINICRLIPVLISLVLNIMLCIFNVYGAYNNLMYIFSLNILALAFDITFFFQGNEEFKKIVIRNSIIKIISVILIFTLVKDENDLNIYALINSGLLVISNLSLWSYMRKYLIRIDIKSLKPLKHLKGTFILFIPTVAISLYTVLDKTLIGILVKDTYTEVVDGKEVIKKYSDLENAYYEQSEKIVKIVMLIITSIGTVMIPRNTHELEIGNVEVVKKNLNTSSRIVMMIGIPLVLGLIVITNNFVPWFFGDGYDKCKTLMKILSPLIIIIGFSNVFGLQYLVPAGKSKTFAGILVVGAIINVCLNFILISRYKSYGAAIATVIAEAIITILMAIACKKEINIFKVLLNSLKYIIAGALMFGVCYFIESKLDSSILNTFIIVGIGFVVYFIALLILYDKFLYGFIKMFINKIKKV